MSRLALSLLVLTMPSLAFAAELPVQSRVDAVTVFPQGAEVSRVVKAAMTASLAGECPRRSRTPASWLACR